MIYVSLSTIPQRIKNINRSVDSLLKQTKKPDKIFINIPHKYNRFNEVINDSQIPKFSNDIVEITRCPVKAALMVTSAVSRSLISPTITISGSCLKTDLRPLAKL